ncbi:hypothetical protein QBC37DRAFT_464026 [Rhypophila decipiens]|uniref:Uncharacterized protein n=1 Tax=Rhypophila decipiens TaxID=261697 RepID=A0AAN6XSP9_9PEZI|nr:hypothetical protein QBC37DRAFT_464026 [Rhypophila decipiens]
MLRSGVVCHDRYSDVLVKGAAPGRNLKPQLYVSRRSSGLVHRHMLEWVSKGKWVNGAKNAPRDGWDMAEVEKEHVVANFLQPLGRFPSLQSAEPQTSNQLGLQVRPVRGAFREQAGDGPRAGGRRSVWGHRKGVCRMAFWLLLFDSGGNVARKDAGSIDSILFGTGGVRGALRPALAVAKESCSRPYLSPWRRCGQVGRFPAGNARPPP